MTGATRAEALLDQLALGADDDYQHAEPPQNPGRERLVTAALVALFAMLVTVAALQAATERPGNQLERQALVSDIKQRQELVATRRDALTDLQAQVDALRAVSASNPANDAGLQLWSGGASVSGPGIRITARSNSDGSAIISDNDLQLMVNGLWYAGAEAISVNGQRLGPTTAIRTAGQAVTVNYRALNEPFVVSAIGGDDLADRWRQGPSGRYWASLSKAVGTRYSVVKVSDDMKLPAVPAARLILRHARIAGSAK